MNRVIVVSGNGILSGSREKSISRDPCMGGHRAVVRRTGGEVNDSPQDPGVLSLSVPLRKKSSLVFVRPRNMGSMQKRCAMPKLSSVQPLPLSGQPSPVPGCAPAGAAVLRPGSHLEPALEARASA